VRKQEKNRRTLTASRSAGVLAPIPALNVVAPIGLFANHGEV
jgi:hypothetical protein